MNQALLVLGATTLLGVIGWVIRTVISVYMKLNDSINKLNISIVTMTVTLTAMQQSNDDFGEGCSDRHKVVDDRLNAHSAKISEHDKDIVYLKTKVK